MRFTFDGFTITNGYALEGGGVHLSTRNYTSEFFNCVFADNTSSNDGGGIHGVTDSTFQFKTLALSNTVFRNNRTENGNGGAIYVSWTHLQIDDSVFESNRVDTATHTDGGAIRIDRGSHRIENTVFRGNRCSSDGHANTGGGAIGLDRGSLLMRNCLVTENHGRYAGGIHVNAYTPSPYYRTLDIRHCAYETAGITTTEYDTVIMSNNIITNRLDFVDPANGDFRLSLTSPCINTGTNRDWHVGAVDLDDNRRVDGMFNKVDMGCYEYQYQGTAIMIR